MKTYKCPECQQTREIWEFGGKKICIHCKLDQIINSIDFINDMLRDNLKELKNLINIIRLP